MTRNKSRKGKTQAKTKSARKASDFAYLMQRKCLRMMRRYYKDRFENGGIFEDYKQQIRMCSVNDLNQAIGKFITNEFPYVVEYKQYGKYTNLEETLKTLILSDRYNKNEPISEGLDFELVRKVLYNFNTRNLLNFFAGNSNALLFYHYFDEYGLKDTENQSDVDPELLYKEMQGMYKEAEKYLRMTMDNFKREGYDVKNSPIYPYDTDYMPDSYYE